jgi:hypothetical protein
LPGCGDKASWQNDEKPVTGSIENFSLPTSQAGAWDLIRYKRKNCCYDSGLL